MCLAEVRRNEVDAPVVFISRQVEHGNAGEELGTTDDDQDQPQREDEPREKPRDANPAEAPSSDDELATTPEGANDRTTGGPSIKASAEVGPRREPGAALPLRISGLVIAGGGVVGLGLGGYYGYVGKHASDVISGNQDGWTSDELAQQKIGERANRNMKIALIGGGAAVVAGAALYFWGRSMRVEEQRLAVVPQLSPESSGLVLSGVFD